MITFDLSAFERQAKAFDAGIKQVRFVCAYALTNAMKDARAAEVDLMRRSFDRPTPYTLNSLQVKPATKARLVAELGFKEGFGGTPAWKYLGPAVVGGKRRVKRFEKALIGAGVMRGGEYAVPTGNAPRNGYGNVTGAFITRMLSALGANTDASQNTRKRPKRSNRKRNLDYFVLRGSKAPDGVYLRQGRRAVPIFLFVRAPVYKQRFPYYQEGRRVIGASFRKHFRVGFQRFIVNDMRRASSAR